MRDRLITVMPSEPDPALAQGWRERAQAVWYGQGIARRHVLLAVISHDERRRVVHGIDRLGRTVEVRNVAGIHRRQGSGDLA